MFPSIVPDLYNAVSLSLCLPSTPGAEGVDVQVHVRPGDEWKTLWVANFSGVETDFLATLSSEVTTAWAYGTRRDLVRACTDTKKAARIHRKEHQGF